ncbi:MAG: hypothetical protein ACE5GE_10535 [Phycisphaerae bacterium]
MSAFWALNSVAAVQAAGSASRKAGEAKSSAAEVEAKCDRALLVCEALWTILRDKLNVSEEELVQRVNDIDLTDGRLDGKVRKANAHACPGCGRTIAKRFPKCMYCGQEVVHDPFS